MGPGSTYRKACEATLETLAPPTTMSDRLMPVALLALPADSAPRSRGFEPGAQRMACTTPALVCDEPATTPSSLIANAALVPPGTSEGTAAIRYVTLSVATIG